MSYQIKYGNRQKKKNCKRKTIKLLIIFSLLVAAFVFALIFPSHIRELRKHVFPFLEPKVTTAFNEMLERIKMGEKFSEAAETFCRMIIYGKGY